MCVSGDDFGRRFLKLHMGGRFAGQRFSGLSSLTPKTAVTGFRRNFSRVFAAKHSGYVSNCLAFEISDKKRSRDAFRISSAVSQMIAVLRVILATLFAAPGKGQGQDFLGL